MHYFPTISDSQRRLTDSYPPIEVPPPLTITLLPYHRTLSVGGTISPGIILYYSVWLLPPHFRGGDTREILGIA